MRKNKKTRCPTCGKRRREKHGCLAGVTMHEPIYDGQNRKIAVKEVIITK